MHHTVYVRFLPHQIEYEFGVAFVTHQLSLQPKNYATKFLEKVDFLKNNSRQERREEKSGQ